MQYFLGNRYLCAKKRVAKVSALSFVSAEKLHEFTEQVMKFMPIATKYGKVLIFKKLRHFKRLL